MKEMVPKGLRNESKLYSNTCADTRAPVRKQVTILGNPGAISRDDAIFSGESLLQLK